MSLRSKIVLILVTVVVLYAAIENGLTRFFTGKIFGSWERQEAEEDLTRIRRRIETELGDLIGKARVLSGWSELARFAAGAAPAPPGSDLGAIMDDAGVDLFYLCDSRGRVLWSRIRDPGTLEPIRLTEFPREALSPSHPALHFGARSERVSGVYMTNLHPLLLGTLPIREPGGDPFVVRENGFRQPAHGAVILGRFLGPELKERVVGEELELAADAVVAAPRRIELLEPGAPGLPGDLARRDGGVSCEEGEDGLLHAYERIDSLRTGEPLVLHVALDRSIAAHRKSSVNYALLSTLIGGLLILFVLLRLLQRIVVAPLSTLTGKAVEIGRCDDPSIRVGLQRPDEIGQLAGEFDRMLEKLARSREQVVETARFAGMSEIATGVLHNVGNVLNSVNVSASMATRRTEELALNDLELLAGVLQQHERDLSGFVARDPRGKHLVPFMNELARALGAQKKCIQEELRSLNQGIEHIAELVRAQQSFAGTRGVFEKARLAEQVEVALSICKQSLEAAGAVEIVREFEDLPGVRVDRHKLMEILVNVLQNAGQALAERGGEGLRLALRIRRTREGAARIEVHDNGVGIPHENLTRIFQHGFTTKKGGHGFGLHVSANAATEMGAKLTARSEGVGRGATFALDIPMEEEAALAAA